MIELIIHKKYEGTIHSTDEIELHRVSAIRSVDGSIKITSEGIRHDLDYFLRTKLYDSSSYEIFVRISDTLQMMKDCHKFYHFKDKDKLIAKLIEVLF